MEVETARPYFFGDIGFWAERTEVHKAAYQGQVSELQTLIQSGASVNIVAVDSITPLHEAAARGQTQCVRLLLDAGAQVDARNVDGSTPLCEACSIGNFECVRLLLEYGAKVNPMLTSRTTSPLHEACLGGVVVGCEFKLLLFLNLISFKLSFNYLFLCFAGNADCVRLVIAKGASLEAYDLYYGTPLHVACANRHLECVKVLLNAGVQVNATRLHETPLHHAAKSNNVDMIELLVEFGANIYARDKYDRKPVDYTKQDTPSSHCLQLYESSPLSLQQLSRITLRMVLGTRAVDVVTKLDIPKRIMSYLLYQ
ncbi:ankyrin repeat and SOCS box protein 13-like [Garra rufa]|uniref:ankyrin repeat and SOCS box protein 13-like n=1 Tax=Garra rufa TaxID=137080 RepID=UPI003CCEC63E